MAKKILGIDIRHSGVSAALISSSLKGERLEDHAYIPVKTDDPASPEFAEAIITALGRMDTAGALCITSLPARGISFRNVTIPFGDVKKVRQILPFEMEPLVPYPIEDVVTECAAVRSRSGEDKSNDVLAMAIPVSDLQSHIDICAAAHIEPDVITVSGFSTALSLIDMTEESEAWLMADISDCSTTLFIVLDGTIRDVRTVAAGTERPKILVNELLRILTAYIDIHRQPISPETLFLTSDGAVDNGIDRMLEDALKLPVQRVRML